MCHSRNEPQRSSQQVWEEVTLSEMNTTFITIEQMEAATDALLENGKKVGADSWQQRVKNQTPHCRFGEEGICCRICTMGPCRITPKSPARHLRLRCARHRRAATICASPPAAPRPIPTTAAASAHTLYLCQGGRQLSGKGSREAASHCAGMGHPDREPRYL